MAKTISQRVVFPGATAKEIYSIYMTSKKHTAATGAPAEISKKVGEKFKAHKGSIRGTNLMLKPGKIIVQSWRGKAWDKAHGDSILTMRLSDSEEGCVLDLAHALLPDEDAAHVKKGWTKMYWSPIKKYIKAQNK